MTKQEIKIILPHFSNPFFERDYICELVILDEYNSNSRTNMASIIKFNLKEFLKDINDAFQNDEDLKNGLITISQLEHTLKIKHSLIAESVEWIYRDKDDEHLTHLFYKFISRVSNYATQYIQSQQAVKLAP